MSHKRLGCGSASLAARLVSLLYETRGSSAGRTPPKQLTQRVSGVMVSLPESAESG